MVSLMMKTPATVDKVEVKLFAEVIREMMTRKFSKAKSHLELEQFFCSYVS